MIYRRLHLLLAVVFALFVATVGSARAAEDRPAPVKNVILLIVDGCSAEQYTLARWFKGSALALDEIRCGSVKTYIADSVIADSAPAATALATGHISNDKLISVGPTTRTVTVPPPAEDAQYRPLATILEAARLQGKRTGIVATSRVTHATPAAFMAHVPSRKMEEEIMEQAVHQGVDVVFGGGRDYLLPKAAGGLRRDGEDLAVVLGQRGYTIVTDRDGLKKTAAGKVFGVFAMGPLAAEIDRPRLAPGQPTLAEMTRKAIELLAAKGDGFFLMVEGSQVDWACHANDPAHLLSDLVAYDDAVAVALEFARRDGQTLLVALSDHNTGGMSIGNARTNKTYSQTSVTTVIEPLKKMKCSAPTMWKELAKGKDGKALKPDEIEPAAVERVVKKRWGLAISPEDAQEILAVAARDTDNPHNAFGEVLCPRYTAVGWTTHGHTGGDVPLHAFGPNRPVGTFHETEIAQTLARALGLDLDHTTGRLFVEAGRAFAAADCELDRTDAANPVVRIRHNGTTAELPVNKNLLRLGGKAVELDGVVLHVTETGKSYLPEQAVRAIKGQ